MGKKKSPRTKQSAHDTTASSSEPGAGSASISKRLPLANIARGSAPRPSQFPSSVPTQEAKATETESAQSVETESSPPVPDVSKFETPEVASKPQEVGEEAQEAEAVPEEVVVEESVKPEKPPSKKGQKGKKAEKAEPEKVAPAKPASKKGKKGKEAKPAIVEAAITTEKTETESEPALELEEAAIEEIAPATESTKPAKSPGKKGRTKSEPAIDTNVPVELAPRYIPLEVSDKMIESIKALGSSVNLEDSCFQVKNIKELLQFACVKATGTKKVRGLASEKLAFKRNAITSAGFANYKDFKKANNYDFELLRIGDPAAKIIIGYLEKICMPDLAERLANKFAQLRSEGGAMRVMSGGAFKKKDGTLGAKNNIFITFDWPGKDRYNKEPNMENIIDAKNIPADVDVWFTKWERERTGKIPKYVYFALKHHKELAKELGKKKLSNLSKDKKMEVLQKIATKLKANKKELEGEATWDYPAVKNQYRVCSYSAIAKKIQRLGKGFLLTSGVVHPDIVKENSPEEYFNYKIRTASQAMVMKAIVDAILSVADNINDILTAKGYLEMKTITPDIIARAIARLGYFKSSIMNVALPELQAETLRG